MKKNLTFHKKKVWTIFLLCAVMMLGLTGRLVYLMGVRADYYSEKAQELHERERPIKAARGKIVDAKGKVLASNKIVCTVSVIHSQIKEPEKIISLLSQKLELSEDTVRKKVEKISSIERMRTNVEKKVGDEIRKAGLAGVKVDEDYKRYYPWNSLASRVLGFTGADNQGIIGLEVEYEDVLSGDSGKILTTTDARGIELDEIGENRKEPKTGSTLRTSLDISIQEYVQQAALKVMEEKDAERVSILLMNPQNGEIYACVNVPEFDLNHPFELNTDADTSGLSAEKKQELLNQMWRNPCLNDTYEPGSTFKIITMAAGLEEGAVTMEDRFYCPGYKLVDDRRIHCANRRGHGSQNFVEGAQNSCNPVFIEVGLRLGVKKYYQYFRKFGLLEKTGVDLPGEAVEDESGEIIKELEYPVKTGILSAETSEKVRYILEKVVSEGSGKNAAIEGYRIGGKTATSQTLPRSANRYISSFLGFAPAKEPQILALCIIHDPKGVYYGGTIAAPVVRTIFENILPYMKIEG